MRSYLMLSLPVAAGTGCWMLDPRVTAMLLALLSVCVLFVVGTKAGR